MVPFYDLCDNLRNLDIDVGVAIPSVEKYTDEIHENMKEQIKGMIPQAKPNSDTCVNKTVTKTFNDVRTSTDVVTYTDEFDEKNGMNDKKNTEDNRNTNNKSEKFEEIKQIPKKHVENYSSNIFALIIKSRGVSIIYHYKPNDKSENTMTMKFTIECLEILLGKQSHSERIFWNSYREIKGIDIVLTKQNALFLNKILMSMKEAQGIEVKNYTNMRYYLEKDGDKTRFFVPLDGLDTVKESVRMLLCLRHSELVSDIEWNVGSLGLDKYNSAPFLFVIKKREIKLVLTDVLDVCLFKIGLDNLS